MSNAAVASREELLSQFTADFQAEYDKADNETKVKLKCWLYFNEGRAKGGKKGFTFADYDKGMKRVDYLKMVKSYCVDVSDIGGVEQACRYLQGSYSAN